MFRSSRIALFAHDIATAMLHADHQLQRLFEVLARWVAAMGQKVNPATSHLVAVGRAVSEYQAVVASVWAARGMQVVRRARYLGMKIGPGAPEV